MAGGSDRFGLASVRCVADDFDGEIVALNFDTGFYFSLRDLSGAIWRDLLTGHSVETVVAALGGPDQPLGAEARRLVDRLQAEGLLEPKDFSEPPQELLTVASFLANGVTAITLHAYDDMRDLVLTDPIHEVDAEIGWPVRPLPPPPQPEVRLALSSPKCVADDFSGEIVAFNLDSGLFFSLRDLGGAIWRDLLTGHSVETVVAALGGPDQPLGAEAARLIDRLQADGLLERKDYSDLPHEPPTVTSFVASGRTAIIIDAYDDMQDLVRTNQARTTEIGGAPPQQGA